MLTKKRGHLCIEEVNDRTKLSGKLKTNQNAYNAFIPPRIKLWFLSFLEAHIKLRCSPSLDLLNFY